MVSKDTEQKIEELYNTYNSVIKPLVAEVEVRKAEFPIELLNELRAYLDHIARCYMENVTEEQEAEQLKKAESHVIRISMDAYKHLIVCLYDNLAAFQKKTRKIDLTTVNNGYFSRDYERMYKEAKAKLKTAKMQESQFIPYEQKIKYYEEAYNAYCSLMELIENNMTAVNWAAVKRKVVTFGSVIFNLVVWIVGIVIGAILTNNNQLIIELLTNAVQK